MKESLGIVGGLPGKSLYFVGYQDWDLLFLDPHILKPSRDLDATAAAFADVHTGVVRAIGVADVDPSMLLGFMCSGPEEVVALREALVRINRVTNVLTIRD